MSTLKGKNFAPSGANSSLLEETPFQKGCTQFWQLSPLKVYLFPLIIFDSLVSLLYTSQKEHSSLTFQGRTNLTERKLFPFQRQANLNTYPAEPSCTLPLQTVWIQISWLLIQICTVCCLVSEFISTIWIKESDWLRIISGHGILIYWAWQMLKERWCKCFSFLRVAPFEKWGNYILVIEIPLWGTRSKFALFIRIVCIVYTSSSHCIYI